MKTYSKYISLLFFSLILARAASGQNLPLLNETAPSGSVTIITPPPVPTTSTGVNFIKTTAPMFPVIDPAQLSAQGPQNLKESYTYTDGFNKVYQTVQSNVSFSNNTYRSLVQVADTRFQKESFSFLPYTSSNFSLQSDVFETQKNYYAGLYPGESYTAYSKSVNAGLGSNISYAPGKSLVGQNRGMVTRRITNIAGEVRIWNIDINGRPVSTGTYSANELFGEEVIAPVALGSDNAAAPSTRVFTDRNGRVILKMVADSSYVTGGGVLQVKRTYLSTYYVYSEMGQLCYTLPPRAVQLIEQNSWTVTATVLDNLCFQYRYDSRGRLKAQRFPGEKDFTGMVYDHKQRIVMVQTPADKAKSQFQLTYYDKLNRVIATSLYSNASAPEEWQGSFDLPPGTYFPANDIRHYMGFNLEGVMPNDDGIPGQQLMTFNFYDNYEVTDPNNVHFPNYNNQLQFTPDLQTTGIAEVPVRSFRTQGQLVGSKIKILPSAHASLPTTGTWSWLHHYYDEKGRLINDLKVDYNDTIVHFTYAGTQYDFLNRPLISKSISRNMNAGATVYAELTKNEYQVGTGALFRTSHKINNGPWNITARYEYDSLGRVRRKGIGNYGEVQDFAYNIRGQLTGINAVYAETGNKAGESRTFGESLKYDYGFSSPQYNGKIAGMVWRGGSGNSHAYGYDYDLSGRLKNAEFRTKATAGWNKTDLDYTVSNVNYDKNGNLLSMDQRGVTPANGVQTIDKLRYSYEDNEQSNRLLKVQDSMIDYGLGDFVNTNNAGNDYSYDPNGNLASDANKSISSITYNHFDKPQVITFNDGKSIEYSYDAAGSKVQEMVLQPGKPTKTTDYIGGYIYEGNKLRYVLTAEGRTVRDTVTDAFKEEYFVKDHLGNVRSTIDVIQKPLLQYLATYELASANLEGLLFEQLNEIRDDKPASTDPGDLKAGRLNGEDQRIGTSLLMHVMAGDQVELNVNSFYDSYNPDDDNPVTSSNMLASIVGTLTGGVGGFVGSEGHNPDMVQQLFTPENYLESYRDIINNNTDVTRPKAYLNYVLFDENMRIDKTFSNAFQANSTGSWEQIGTAAPLTIPVNGYLAVYLSNESRGISCYDCANVNFDQLVIRLQKGRQLEETHYYPFGLPMAGLSSAAENNTITQRRKYQSNEYIKDIGLNWMDFHARQYDPQLGRFLGVDPLAASGGQDMYSPYAAMGNAPESMIDPNGEQFLDPSWHSYARGGGGSENSDWGPASGDGGGGGYGGAPEYGGYVDKNGNWVYDGSSFGDNPCRREEAKAQAEAQQTWGAIVGIWKAQRAAYTANNNLLSNKDLTLASSIPFGWALKRSGVIGWLLDGIGDVFGSAHVPNWALMQIHQVGTISIVEAGLLAKTYRFQDRDKQNGSYTIIFSNGQKYHGKGTAIRMTVSAIEKMAIYKDEHGKSITVKSFDWTPATTERDAFKQEYRRMQTDRNLPIYPEGYMNPINYNIIQSPGKLYIEQDGF